MPRKKPATTNALMKHLRASGVAISGTAQKRKLRNIGYYHGYKGYRFAGDAANRLPITDFNQVVLLHDFDMQLKALLYPRMMLVETALKNRTLDAVVADARSDSFEDIWRSSLTAYRSYSGSRYGKAWGERMRLRGAFDAAVTRYHNDRDVIRHFRDADRDIPIWALFEVITLGEFGMFYSCLDRRVKTAIVRDLQMPTNIDSEAYLKAMIYALKDCRNALAHNGAVLDVRFKTGSVNRGVSQVLQSQMGVSEVDFSDITDYVLLLVYLMRRMQFTQTECKQFLSAYEDVVERYRAALPTSVFSRIVNSSTRGKLAAAADFVASE